MSFDIAQTSTLHVVATEDQGQLAEALRDRLTEALAQADAEPEVASALEAQKAAEQRLDRLRKAERVLSQFSKVSREQAAAAAGATLDRIINSASSGPAPDFGKLTDVVAIENRDRYATRAIQRIVEHLIPAAELVRLREESHALMAQARVLERIAQERAERVLGQLRGAVTEEVVLPVDMSKGVAGALLAHAGALRRRSIQISEDADRMERA